MYKVLVSVLIYVFLCLVCLNAQDWPEEGGEGDGEGEADGEWNNNSNNNSKYTYVMNGRTIYKKIYFRLLFGKK